MPPCRVCSLLDTWSLPTITLYPRSYLDANGFWDEPLELQDGLATRRRILTEVRRVRQSINRARSDYERWFWLAAYLELSVHVLPPSSQK